MQIPSAVKLEYACADGDSLAQGRAGKLKRSG